MYLVIETNKFIFQLDLASDCVEIDTKQMFSFLNQYPGQEVVKVYKTKDYQSVWRK